MVVKDAAAYRFLGHCLNPAASTPELPGEADWPALVALGSHHWLLPGLATALYHRGLEPHLPAALVDHLQALHELNAARNQQLRTELLAICAHLNELEVEPLLLKGAIALVEPLYPNFGDRMMSDLDVLVPTARLEDCRQHLLRAGWDWDREIPALLWQNKHHAPPLFHPEHPAAVELHGHGVERRHRHLLSTGDFHADSERHEVAGVALRIPTPAVRLRHNLVHTQLTDRHYQYARLNLRQLWEWVMLRKRFDGHVAWPSLSATLGAQAVVLEGYLLAASTFFGQAPPPGLTIGHDGRRAHARSIRVLRQPGYARLLGFRADTKHLFRVRLPHLRVKLPSVAWWRFQWRRRIKNL